MRSLFLFFLSTLIVFKVWAQSREDEAQTLFMMAQQAYDEHRFKDADDNLDRCIGKLGSNNAKIQYLRIKNANDAIANNVIISNYNNYKRLLDFTGEYFKMADKTKVDPEKYKEILMIKLKAEDIVNLYTKRKLQYESLKSREARFIIDTIDVFMSEFVQNFNKCAGKESNYEDWPRWAKYDKGKHLITVVAKTSIFKFNTINSIKITENGEDKPYNYYWKRVEFGNAEKTNSYIIYKAGTPVFHMLANETYKYFDCSCCIGKIVELISILNSTGFNEYFSENGFADVKNITLND